MEIVILKIIVKVVYYAMRHAGQNLYFLGALVTVLWRQEGCNQVRTFTVRLSDGCVKTHSKVYGASLTDGRTCMQEA